MTEDHLRLLHVMADPCSHPPGYTRDREAIAAALEEIERLHTDESNFLTFGQGGADYQESQWIAKLAKAEQSRDREIERLKAERDGYRRGLAQIQGEDDPDWDVKFAVLLIENATLVREVERLRKAAGMDDDTQVRAVLDQAARDTAAVAGRERAGEAIDGETMDFRMGHK